MEGVIQSVVDQQPTCICTPSKVDRDPEEEGESSDSGYSGSQQSDSESSDSALLESDGDSRELSQASSEELPETNKNRPMLDLNLCLLDNLEGKLLLYRM